MFEVLEDDADFLFMGVGILSRWKWPDIAGLHDFKGVLVHSANWDLGGASWEDDVKDWGSKDVAVVGLVSRLLAGSLHGAHGLPGLVRAPNYISTPEQSGPAHAVCARTDMGRASVPPRQNLQVSFSQCEWGRELYVRTPLSPMFL